MYVCWAVPFVWHGKELSNWILHANFSVRVLFTCHDHKHHKSGLQVEENCEQSTQYTPEMQWRVCAIEIVLIWRPVPRQISILIMHMWLIVMIRNCYTWYILYSVWTWIWMSMMFFLTKQRWAQASWYHDTAIFGHFGLMKSECKLEKCIRPWMIEVVYS